MRNRYSSYHEFWRAYTVDHAGSMNRFCHILGTLLAVFCWLFAVITRDRNWLWLALGFGVVPGWIGHLVFRRSFPVTFLHPFWSFASDLRMAALWCTGSLARQMNQAVPRSGPSSIGMYEPMPESMKKKGRRRRRPR